MRDDGAGGHVVRRLGKEETPAVAERDATAGPRWWCVAASGAPCGGSAARRTIVDRCRGGSDAKRACGGDGGLGGLRVECGRDGSSSARGDERTWCGPIHEQRW